MDRNKKPPSEHLPLTTKTKANKQTNTEAKKKIQKLQTNIGIY
jgi:hypothetical protein